MGKISLSSLRDLFFNKISLNAFYLTGGEVFSKIILLLLTIIIARYMGATQLGIFSFVYSLVTIFFILSEFGMNTLINVAVVKNKHLANRYLWNSLVAKLFLSLLSIIILVIFLFLSKKEAFLLSVSIASIAFIFVNLNMSFASLFRAFEKMHYEMLVKVVKNSLFFLLSLYFIFFTKNIVNIFYALLFSNITGLILNLYFFRKLSSLSPGVDVSFMKLLFRKSWPYAMTSFFVIIYFKVDIIMLSLLQNEAVSGAYFIAAEILNSLILLPHFLILSMFPSLFSSMKDVSILNTFFSQSLRIQGFLTALIAIVIFFFSKPLILVVFGPTYLASLLALQIIIFTLIFIGLNISFTYLYYAAGYEKKITFITAIGALLNILLNLLLIPRYSLYGAAIATLITEFILFILCSVSIRKIAKLDNFIIVSKLISITSFVVLLYLILQNTIPLLVNVLINIGLYFFLSSLLKLFPTNMKVLIPEK